MWFKNDRRIVFFGAFLFISLFLLVLPITNLAFAQIPNAIVWNISDFVEQENDIRLEGYQPSYSFFLPYFKGVNWEETRLALKIWFSEVLNPESRVSLFINEQLAYTQLLKDIQIQPDQVAYLDIPIPETALKPNNQLIKIEIQPTLFISSHLGEDISSGNLWIIVKKESFITFKMKTDWIPQTIDDFLQSIKEAITLVLPPRPWSDRILQSYFTLYAFLHKIHREQPFRIQTLIAPSQLSSKDSKHNYQIYLIENSVSDYQLYGRKLFLTFEGIKTISSELHQFLIGKGGKTSYVTEDKISPRFFRTTFFDLGYSSFKFKGFGNMEKNLRFYFSDISHHPTSLNLRLFFNHTPLPSDFKGEAFFKLSINSQLVYSQRLNDKSSGHLFPIDLYLPAYFLKPVNTITLGLSYFPNKEDYRPGKMPFEGFISEDSYFQVKSSSQSAIFSVWKRIPTVLDNKMKIVLPSELDENTLQIAADILSSIQLYNSRLIPVEIIFGETQLNNLLGPSSMTIDWDPNFYPDIWDYHWANFIQLPKQIELALSSSNFRNLNLLQKIPAAIYNITIPFGQFIYQFFSSFLSNPITIEAHQKENFLLIIVSPETIPNYLFSPVFFESGKMVVKDAIQDQTHLTTTLNEPISCLAFFYQNHIPVMLFTTSGPKSVADNHFKKYFNLKTTFSSISGNLVIFEKNGIIDATISENSLTVNGNKFLGYFSQYISNQRILLLFILGMIIILVIIFYYQKKNWLKNSDR